MKKAYLFLLFLFLFVSCSKEDDSSEQIVEDPTPEEQSGNNQTGSSAYLTCPDNHHPHLIDLGLPSGTKWACCNVDATVPEEYGGYYAWGETEQKKVYNWDTYKYKGNMDIGADIAGTQYDVAHVKWGDSWRMPTSIQLTELIYSTKFTRLTQNNIGVLKFTGENGGTIILPLAGGRENEKLVGAGSNAIYASSVAYWWKPTEFSVYDLYYSSSTLTPSRADRYNGSPIRPVSQN